MTEKFLFRGLILRGLLAKVSPVNAIVISALLFSLMHLNPWQMPTAFIIGLILGWVYLRTRSLTLCMVGHGFNNAIVLLSTGLPFTIDGFNREQTTGAVLHQPWWLNLIGISMIAVGLYLFNRMAPVIAWTKSDQQARPPLLPADSESVAVKEEVTPSFMQP